MKLSLDKMGCHCSALLLSELLGVDIFLSKSNDGGSCYLLGFAMNSNFISSLSHTSYHLSLSFLQFKQSSQNLALLVWTTKRYVVTFYGSSAHLNSQVKSSFIPLSCLTIEAYCYCDHITSHYIPILEISKVRSCLSLYTIMKLLTQGWYPHTCIFLMMCIRVHPMFILPEKFNKKYLIYALYHGWISPRHCCNRKGYVVNEGEEDRCDWWRWKIGRERIQTSRSFLLSFLSLFCT